MVGQCFQYMNTRQEKMVPPKDNLQRDMRNSFLIAEVSGVLQYWLYSGIQVEPAQVAAAITSFCKGVAQVE